MVEMTFAESDQKSAAPGLAARLMGVLVSPAATYADIAATPRWLGALAVVVLISAGGTAILFSTTAGQRALIDQQVHTLQTLGLTVDDVAYQRIQQSAGRAPYFTAIGQMITLPLGAAIVAGLALFAITVLLGGRARFTQVYAVVAHSGIIIACQQLVALPLDYFRESLSSPTTLGALLPMVSGQAFAGRLLASIDLFILAWMVNLATGLSVLARRRTGPIAATLVAIYLALAVAIAALRSAAGT